MVRLASSADSAEPDTAMTRRASRSRERISSSPTSISRESRIGTVIRVSAWCFSSASRVNFGSALRAITRVLPSPRASIELSSPHAWKAGAESTAMRPERSGIFDR